MCGALCCGSTLEPNSTVEWSRNRPEWVLIYAVDTVDREVRPVRHSPPRGKCLAFLQNYRLYYNEYILIAREYMYVFDEPKSSFFVVTTTACLYYKLIRGSHSGPVQHSLLFHFDGNKEAFITRICPCDLVSKRMMHGIGSNRAQRCDTISFLHDGGQR